MISYKKKIYFLLSSEAYLEPVSGDRINEMNVIKAMLDEYEVYYNGILVKKDDKAFGDKNKIINIPKEGEYDLVYIRNNKDVFLKSPSPKLWFASPYDEDCFNQADGIVCMTKPWKNALSTYDYEKYDYFKGTYPVDMLAPKAC
ncbi:TPA: glycosyltransferase family 1 protein, partial [Vibrio cholerae]